MKKLLLLSIAILFIYGCSAEDKVVATSCNCDKIYEQQTYNNATHENVTPWVLIATTNVNFTQDCSRDGELSNVTSNNNTTTQITIFKRNRIICK